MIPILQSPPSLWGAAWDESKLFTHFDGKWKWKCCRACLTHCGSPTPCSASTPPSKAALEGTVAQTRKCGRRSSWSGKAAKYILSPTHTTSSSPLSTGRCASLLIITFSLFFYIPSQIEYTWSIVKHQSILIFSLIGFSAATISPFWSSTWEYSLLTGMLSTFIIDHFLAKRCRWKKIVKKKQRKLSKTNFSNFMFHFNGFIQDYISISIFRCTCFQIVEQTHTNTCLVFYSYKCTSNGFLVYPTRKRCRIRQLWKVIWKSLKDKSCWHLART